MFVLRKESFLMTMLKLGIGQRNNRISQAMCRLTEILLLEVNSVLENMFQLLQIV